MKIDKRGRIIKMKKALSLFLSAGLFLGMLSGCSNNTVDSQNATQATGETAEQSSKTFVFASTQPTVSMDPANGYSGWYTVRYGVGETLFKLDESLQPQPWLAESYENTGELTWTIQIKEGITFQNGKALTADAVKACLERTLELNDRAPTLLMIESLEADGQTLTITTSVPNPTLLNGLCDASSCIIDVEEEASDMQVTGTGPYIIQSFTPKSQCVLLPYDGYWNGTPKLSQATFKGITDGDTMTMALQSGEVDATEGLPYSSHSLFASDSNYKISSSPTSRVFMLYYNYDSPFMSNANVRKAISMCVDKQTYSSVLLYGAGTPTTGVFPATLPYGGEQVTDVSFDLEGAKALLELEGYVDTDGDGIREKDGQKLSLSLLTYSSRVELPIISEALQAQLREIGMELSIEISESIDERLHEGNFDIATYAYITAPTGDPFAYLSYVFQTDGVSNYGNFSNADVDALIEELKIEFDTSRRAELAVQIQQKVLDENAFCFITHLNMAFVMKANVTGLEIDATDYYQLNVDTDVQ